MLSVQKMLIWCKKHKLTPKNKRFWGLGLVLSFLIWFLFCLPDPLFKTPYSTVLEDQNGVFLSAQIAADYQWRFPQSDSVPYKFRESIRYFEDQYFYYHFGVNPISMGKAFFTNIAKRSIVRGGSTLSMQVIRLAKNHQKRNVITKIYEMILAVRLEFKYSKKEIMAMYAAHAPFGGNIVGLEAASWRYYNRPSNMLSWGESATLAVLPNAPSLVFPGKKQQTLLKKRNLLLQKLFEKGLIDQITCSMAQHEPLPEKAYSIPQNAQHLLQKTQNDGFKGKRVATTIKYNTQVFANQLANKYAQYYSGNYINNLSIIVLDTKTGNVLAYVGNANLVNKTSEQYVDNVVSRRSSGSILKPFLFAGALDEGLILPNSFLIDIPTRVGGYAPKNFENSFEGALPASDALAKSLNIPFVRLLRDFGISKFITLLNNVGFTSIKQSANHYGLSLILGGADVSLWETTGIYASMGRSLMRYSNDNQYNKSDFHGPRYLPIEEEKEVIVGKSYFSAGSIYATFQALTKGNRPGSEIGWELFASTYKIAWKTGTSFGHRDAWAVGVTPEYTIGVWVGNSTGVGRPGLTGLSHAAPIMFEMFKYLQPKKWFKEPQNDMVTIDVCAQTGFRANPQCETIKTKVPKNALKAQMCPYHTSIFMDSTRKYRVTSDCYPVTSMISVPWFVLPPAIEWFYKKNHPEYVLLPDYLKGCRPKNELVFDILHPDNNSAIYIPEGLDSEEGMIIFEAVHRDSKAILYWHIDQEFVTSTNGIHKIEVSPAIGKHVLHVVDKEGNTISRSFSVVSK